MKSSAPLSRLFVVLAILCGIFVPVSSCLAQSLQHRYNFNSGANDSVGGANGTLVGNSYITNNMLYLPGGGTSANPSGYVNLPNGIVTNDTSITVECWLTDNGSLVWAEAWCFGDSAAGPGNPPTSGTSYISLIPRSAANDFRGAFNLTGGDEIDVIDTAGPLPTGTEQYAVVTYDAASTTARLYLNGTQVATASISTNLAPANYGNTYNNWLGRDEFGSDPMFQGTIDELRIWNGAVSPLYIAVSAFAGPNILLTNLNPVSASVVVTNTTMTVGQTQQAVVTENFLQVSNFPATVSATNWNSSNPNVLSVSGTGLITAVSGGTATITATISGLNATSAAIVVPGTNHAAGITVAYWQFNNATNLGLDSGPLGNNLTTGSGAPAYSSTGEFGGALYLNGSSTMTTLSGVFPIGFPTNSNPYSIALWEKVDTGCPNNGGFIGWGINNMGGANNLRLGDSAGNSDAVDNYWWNNDFYIGGLTSNPADGNWHAIAATWDGTNQILYVDGVNVGNRVPAAPNVQAAGFVVGKTTGDVNFKGWLEDLLVANAAMTPADIAVYQSGSWLAPAPAVPQLPVASPTNSVFLGTTVTLSVVVIGIPPFQYQWQKNGTNLPSATAPTLVLSNTVATDSGNYDVVVGNAYGTNTSPALALTVTVLTNLTPLAIHILVTNTTMTIGQNQQATVTEDLVQVSNYLATASATNWVSSNPSILTVSSNGLITSVSPGSATVSATVHGVTGTSPIITVSSLPSPTAYFPLDGDVLDHSGNGNNGINNGATFVTPAYISSEAAQFNGTSYIQIPESIGLSGSGFTIAMWLKTTDTGGGPNWYSGEGLVDGEVAGVTTDFGTALVQGNFALGVGQPDTTLPSASPINDGNWHHAVATWNMSSGAMNLYVDGALSASGTGPTGPRSAPPSLRIGSIQTGVGGGFLNGTIDEVLLYNSEFTAQQVTALYSSYSAAPQVGTPSVSPSNTVYAGTTVTLSVFVVGKPPFQYQWQKNGTNIVWGTSASLVLTNTIASDSGTYDVVASNNSGTNTSATVTLAVDPGSAPIFVQQPAPANVTNYQGGFVTFSAAVNGSQPIQLQWQHNGQNIPNATASGLTLASLQPSEEGSYSLVASNSFGVTNSLPAALTILPPPNPSVLNVLTYHYDNTRQGANTNEVLLTPANVNVSTFGKLLTYPTDGYIIAQPLYVYGLAIPGQGVHNTVFVTTENNSIYAFDADSNAGTNAGVLWHVNLGVAASSYTGEFGTRYQGTYYGDIVPVVGITGTPVISLTNGTLYVSVHTREVTSTATNYFHRIHALDITDGLEQLYSPVVVTSTVPGTGVDSSKGIVTFNARQENQRPALTLAGGMLYVGYGSYEDTDPYHGWVFGFNATNLAQSSAYVFNTTPNATKAAFGANAGEGALWMGGGGLCVDASNNLYFATANGSFSAQTNGGDYSDAFLKLSTTNGFKVADYFSPYNQGYLASADLDLGSGGTILLPDSVGSAAHPHLMVGAGKGGTIHLVDRDNMGHFNAANDSQIVQELSGAVGAVRSTPAYFNNVIYYQGDGDVMRAFAISNAVIKTTPISTSAVTINVPGGTPVVTGNGTNNGIVWVVQPDAYGSGGPAVLHAFAATNLAVELYNSSQNLNRDNPGGAIRMTTPTIINGKVFVGAQYQLSIFGNSLFLATPLISPSGGLFTNSIAVSISEPTPNCTIYYTLDGTLPTTNSLVYTGPFILTTSANVQAIAAQLGTPNSAVASAGFVDTAAVGTGTGLLGAYWSNTTGVAFTNLSFSAAPTLVRTDAVVNFNWTTTPPTPAIGLSNFVARWTGTVQPEYSELYTFSGTVAGGMRLFINGQLLINAWTSQPLTTWSNSIRLTAQQVYNIEMDYFNQSGAATAQLYWSSPSTTKAIIPQTQLYPNTNPPPSVVLTAPADGASYSATASVTVSADADAPINPISYVSLYANNNLLGSESNTPYTLTATGLAAGSYALTAVAVDGSGLSSTSAPVNITVNTGTGQPYGLTNVGTVPAFLNMPTTSSGALPPQLSGTGIYADNTNRTPASGLIPYAPNAPQWKDNAFSSWFMALPNNGAPITPNEQIQFQPTNYWSFPAGSVFVKNWDLTVNETNSTVRRLETQVLVRDNNGSVYGVTYKWRPDNSDADLLSGSLSENILITNASGVRTQTWYYASSLDCQECHNAPVAGNSYGVGVLGVNARELNGNLTYPSSGITDNQLRTLNRLGFLYPAINETNISGYAHVSAITNLSTSLQDRVRSYLDANCQACHQPGGQGITFDARFDTPLQNQNITNAPAAFNLGYDNACVVKSQDVWRSVLWQRVNTLNTDIQMPDFRTLIDTNFVAVLTAWINSLPGTPAEAPPIITPNGGNYFNSVGVAFAAPDTNAVIYYTLDGSLPTTNSLAYAGPLNLTSNVTVSASAWRTNFNNSAAANALFFVTPLHFSSANFLTNQQFQLDVIGLAGSNYVLQASTNLQNWISISTNTATSNAFILFDAKATNFSRRFYRIEVP